jgi:hypothetical protein
VRIGVETLKVRLLILMSFFASLAAQTPPATGSISGRVVDLETGAPLAGIRLGSQSTGRVTTDAEGRYVLRNVPPGTVTVFVTEMNGGYTNVTLNIPKRVTVVPERDTTGVDFRVRMDAGISGRVLDENGEPLPGIEVSVVERAYPSDLGRYAVGGLALQPGRTVMTDDRGAYRFDSGVFSGRPYYLVARLPKRYDNPVSDVPSSLESRKRVLVPTYHPNAVSVDTATVVVLKSLEHRTDVDIRMRRAANYCISGILSAGATPARMRFVIEEETVPLAGTSPSGIPTRAGETGDDGKFRVCDLYPGRFQLVAAQPSAIADFTAFRGTEPVTISNADVSGLNLATISSLAVPGEIAWDQTPADTSLRPTIGIWQNPRPRMGSPGPTVQVTVPGEFSLPMVPTLDHSIAISTPVAPGASASLPGSLYVKDITYGGASVMHGSIQPRDPSTRLRIILGSDGGSINVTATRPDGAPAAHAAVIVFPAVTQSEAHFATRLKAGLTDDTGAYQLPNVPPGRYYVLVTDDPPVSLVRLPGTILDIVKTPENLSRLQRVRGGGQLVEVGARAAVQVRATPKPLE